MPGVAETIDWATALTELDKRGARSRRRCRDTLGVLLKYQDDIARIEQRRRPEAAGRGEGRRRAERRLTDRPDRHADMAQAGAIASRRTRTAGSPTTSSISPARLREAGLRVGPAAVIDAIEAVQAAGIGSRDDFYWTLHSRLRDAARGSSRSSTRPSGCSGARASWSRRCSRCSRRWRADNRAEGEAARRRDARVAEALFEGRARRSRQPRSRRSRSMPVHRLRAARSCSARTSRR